MPIPAVLNPEELRPRPELRLVPAARTAHPAPVPARACAHFVDLCVVQGFSLSTSKFFSALIVGTHLRDTEVPARAAAGLFRDGFSYADSYLFAASFTALALLYFVGLPHALGRTFGLALFGLRLEGDQGGRPRPQQLAMRLAGCFLAYASGGVLCLTGLRKRGGHFLHDEMSRTRVVKA